jgi:hypothetical protein
MVLCWMNESIVGTKQNSHRFIQNGIIMHAAVFSIHRYAPWKMNAALALLL